MKNTKYLLKSGKSILLSFFFTCITCSLHAQTHIIDSLKNVLKSENDDTNKVKTLNTLSDYLELKGKYDTSMICANSAQILAEKLKYKKGLAYDFTNMGNIYMRQGNYSKAIEYQNKSMDLNLEIGNKIGTASNLSNLGIVYNGQGNYTKSLEYYNKALTMEQELADKSGIARNLGNMGIVYQNLGNYPKALECFLKALAMKQELRDKRGIANNLGNIGQVYTKQGNYPKALEYFLKTLPLFQETGSKVGVCTTFQNIGNIYMYQSNYSSALEYDLKALTICQEIGNKEGIAANLGNIGEIYIFQKDYPKALECEFKAEAISREIGNKSNEAECFSSIGAIYLEENDYTRSLEYNFNSLAINRAIGNKDGIAVNLGEVGNTYTKQKNFKQAKIYFDSALQVSKNIGDKDVIKGVYQGMAVLDSVTGNYKIALEDYKNYIIYRDSLVNEANTKKTVQEQMNFEFEQKQATEKAEQDKKDAVADQDRNKQKVIRNSFIAGFTLMLALAFFIFRGFRQKQKANIIITQQKEEVEKQKTLVEHQKALVEEKNKDILDSITYAKRLQDAILPPVSIIKQYLPESFVLYKPKDIVAGDFYWMERTGDNILIAAADCTGHGVPGALVSVVCSNALNRTVKEFRITEPGKILDKVRELVLETFEKSDGNIQDGMDISLCCLNTKTQEIQWSGAYNSLWYIHNNEIFEVAADKQPIGKTDKALPFNTHNLQLQKGDSLYLFTDGYADQFGGPKGKKYKYKQLQQLIMENAQLPMQGQKQLLEHTFEEWKGILEQVDDVLIIGIRI